MVFGSIEEVEAYLKKCMASASQVMAEETKDSARNIISSQLIGYGARPSGYPFDYQGSTGATQNTPTTVMASATGMEVELQDNGGWYSVMTGGHFFSLDGLESGSTWGRGATSIMSNWESWCSANLDKIFLSSMQGMGVPIG